MINFSKILNSIMTEKNLNANQLAQMIGVNVSQVKKWIIGQSKPRYKNLKAICLALKIRADVILGLKDK